MIGGCAWCNLRVWLLEGLNAEGGKDKECCALQPLPKDMMPPLLKLPMASQLLLVDLSIPLVHLKMAFHLSSTEASITTSLLHSNAMSLPLPSLDNLHVPAARLRDLLMLSAGDSPNSVFDHMLLQKLSTHDSQNAAITTADSNMGNKDPKVCPYSVADGENSNSHKEKVIQNHVDDNNILCSRSKTTVGSRNEDVGILTPTNTRGVITRSMTRLKRRTSERLKRLRLSSSELKEKVLRR
ncbi:hypothetical protein ES319_D08G086600v1 [Gossypium barbadense]|uniref:Uncharacterized protein n=1 Tax=Gossypium barbadense TaxID=3634 RepID=A0A5J5QBT0_GOSBA|nr:hypothetical protein ES319_D08G086600v1 [Gossypium barbadense]